MEEARVEVGNFKNIHMKITTIDVRTKEEYLENGVSFAINIPIQDLISMSESEVDKLLAISKTGPIQVYCFSGSRAEMAKHILESFGYQDVANIGGVPTF